MTFRTVASKSIRDRRLTGTRIPSSKRQAAIFLLADNLAATKVATIVGISLDSVRGIRDREHELIMAVRTMAAEQYYRLWEEDITACYNGEAEKEYQQFWQEVRKKQKQLEKTFKLPPTSAKVQRSRGS